MAIGYIYVLSNSAMPGLVKTQVENSLPQRWLSCRDCKCEYPIPKESIDLPCPMCGWHIADRYETGRTYGENSPLLQRLRCETCRVKWSVIPKNSLTFACPICGKIPDRERILFGKEEQERIEKEAQKRNKSIKEHEQERLKTLYKESYDKLYRIRTD
jgi:predicted RNA-binding Zn-ribbon protein involved in translation (DUF1610 family)